MRKGSGSLVRCSLLEQGEMPVVGVTRGGSESERRGWISTDIHAAAAHEMRHGGENSVFDFLISCGVTTEEVDDDGRTPLHYAQSVSACKCLVARGVNIYAADRQGDVAIHAAASNNNSEIFAFLLSLMADDLHEKPAIGNRVVEIVSQCRPSIERAIMMAKIISHKAASWDFLHINEHALLQLVEIKLFGLTEKSCYERVEDVLIRHLTGTPGLQKVLDKALIVAAHSGTPERIQHLVGIGASVKCSDKDGNQPLHIATSSDSGNSVLRVQALIDCGALVTKRNAKGRTSLHTAL
eukprot:m.279062 g.279062  ORF g.279062 m.279062 type:complete len:296 (+) comp40619_c0_seq5:181-1068(+)